ncbi:MAG: flagellar biosynthetic protein FliO [Candidatus Eremiobacterota bacterium]
MNLYQQLQRSDARRMRRGLGSAVLLAVLTLCVLATGLVGRAQPPATPAEQPTGSERSTMGDLMTRTPAEGKSPSAQNSTGEESRTAPASAASPHDRTASPTPAASPATYWSPAAQEGRGVQSAFVHKAQEAAFMLLVISLLAWVSLKLAQKWLPGLAPAARAQRRIEILDRQSLGGGAILSVVRVGQRYLVLGQTEHGVNTLAEVTPDDLTPPAPAPAAEPEAPEATPTPEKRAVGVQHSEILRHYMSIIPGLGSRK